MTEGHVVTTEMVAYSERLYCDEPCGKELIAKDSAKGIITRTNHHCENGHVVTLEDASYPSIIHKPKEPEQYYAVIPEPAEKQYPYLHCIDREGNIFEQTVVRMHGEIRVAISDIPYRVVLMSHDAEKKSYVVYSDGQVIEDCSIPTHEGAHDV